MMKWPTIAVSALTLLGVSILTTPVKAQEAASPEPYSGALLTRSTLTGDWGGVRNDWSAKGVTFDASVTQIEQGVVSGGKNGSWEYGGRGNLSTLVDTQKCSSAGQSCLVVRRSENRQAPRRLSGGLSHLR
jgi:carbohydrate-selective porin OprB